MENQELIQLGETNFVTNYKQYPIILDKGQGCYIEDLEGKVYLDFVAGIATNALGYAHPKLVAALSEQVSKMTHCSNLYWNQPAIEAADKLVKLSGLAKVFFCNSGAEANEAAMKMARKYAKDFVDPQRHKIITMKNSFHGRTLATVTATGQEKYQQGFEPLLPGIEYGVFNDIDSIKALIDDETAAVMVEPLQGEGGIVPAELEFLKALRTICDDKKIVLVFDEVQCGMGRLGEVFAFQYFGVVPDIVALAKGLGAGIPVGAIVANAEVAKALTPGTHGSTFGGNPLATTAVNVVLDALINDNLLKNVREQGAYLTQHLQSLKSKFEFIKEVRGIGFMQGIELTQPVGDMIGVAMQKGLLLVNAGPNIIRFVPALIAKKEEIDKMIVILESVFSEVKA